MKYPHSNQSYSITVISAFLAMFLLVSGRVAQLHAESSPAPPLKVAFVISNSANVIDMTGTREVFQDTTAEDRPGCGLLTVSESADAITMNGGLRVLHNYTCSNSPHRDVVVIGANRG